MRTAGAEERGSRAMSRSDHARLDVHAVIDAAQSLGIALGKSIYAMERRPTFEQEEDARRELGRQFGDRASEIPAWNAIGAAPFRSGYALGKMDGAGAR